MRKLELYKYAASYPNIIQKCGENLFDIQKELVNSLNDNQTFCPIEFFSSCIELIVKLPKCVVNYSNENSKIPCNIIVDDLVLIVKNCKINIFDITILYIRHYDIFKNFIKFNSKAYYSQYHSNINEMYSDSNLTNETKASLFFCEYGYWNSLLLQYVNPLHYTCSHPEILIGLTDTEVINHYHNNYNILSFDPYIYIASNIKELLYLVQTESKTFIFDEDRIYRHYIRHGYKQSIVTDKFNIYEYLANNKYAIKHILMSMNPNCRKICWIYKS